MNINETLSSKKKYIFFGIGIIKYHFDIRSIKFYALFIGHSIKKPLIKKLDLELKRNSF